MQKSCLQFTFLITPKARKKGRARRRIGRTFLSLSLHPSRRPREPQHQLASPSRNKELSISCNTIMTQYAVCQTGKNICRIFFFFFFPSLVFVLYFGRIIREWGRSVGAGGGGQCHVCFRRGGGGGGTRVLPRCRAQRMQVLYSGAFRYRAVRFHNAFASTFSLVF